MTTKLSCWLVARNHCSCSMLIDQNGAAVRLGRQIGQTGGEGSVYSVGSHSGFVAKIYQRPQPMTKIAKLKYQTEHLTSDLKKYAAWPLQLLMDEHRQPRGVLMQAVGGKEIHHLFGTRDRAYD